MFFPFSFISINIPININSKKRGIILLLKERVTPVIFVIKLMIGGIKKMTLIKK